LKHKGISPRFCGVIKESDIGLWFERAEGMMQDSMSKEKRRKSLLMRKRYNIAAMWLRPDRLLFQVYLPFRGLIS